ncbi:MAG: hypothetical protein HZA77_02975 [Candidatus Schekmanbacteria bacterium]|nr:hypothetical protein [Candidatus Schekmanbacteria bacterium]
MGRNILKIFFYLFLFIAVISPFLKVLPIIVPVAFAVIVAIIAFILLPLLIKENPAQMTASNIEEVQNTEADFILVISSFTGSRKDSHEMEWLNILSKECGFFGMYRLTSDENFIPQNGRVIIFTAEAVEEISSSSKRINKLLGLVRETGRTVLLECPDNRIELLTGVSTGPLININLNGIRFSSRGSDKSLFPTGLPKLLCRQITSQVENEEIISEVDGLPIILRCRSGKGIVVSIFFKISDWRFLLSQGGEKSKKQIISKAISLISLSHRQTSDSSCLNNKRYEAMPFLDIFERSIILTAAECEKVPTWWYYPDGKSSAAILTFDEDYCGDEAADVLSMGDVSKLNPMFFMMSSTPARHSTFELLRNRRLGTGIHWNRFHLHATVTGMHMEKEKSLSSQIKKLSEISGSEPASVSRIHYLVAESDPAKIFLILQQAGIKIDSSFGPGRNMGGYIFGTGFPYNPENDNGTPAQIYELPFQVHEPHGKLSVEQIESIIRDSAEKFNSPVVLLFHPHYCVTNAKSKEKLERITAFISGDDRIWKTGINNLVDYFNIRKKSRVFSYRTGKSLKIDAEALAQGQTLKLQQSSDIVEIKVDGNSLSSDSYREKGLIILEQGKHLIEVEYR